MNLSYILNHLGEERENYFNAMTPPVIQTSNFVFRTFEEFEKAIQNEHETSVYTRGLNPTIAILAKKIAALEEMEDCLVTASGMAAISTAVLSCVEKNSHIICVQHPYSWTNKLFNYFLEKFGIKTTFVDGTDAKKIFEATIPETKLIYLESPNTFTFELQDIEAISQFAKSKNIITILDNSYSSPLSQKPSHFGIDIVVHSATKYLNGHSDVVAGVICSSKKMIFKMFKNEFLTLGGIISPMNAWLMLRGLRTLPLRMKHSAESAEKIVHFLQNHPKIEKIYYPFLPTNPQFALAKKQMTFNSGLFSVLLRTNSLEKVKNFCNSLRYFLLAVSWGGYESLIFPAGISHCDFLPQNLIRFYIGLEETDVLISDLEKALEKV